MMQISFMVQKRNDYEVRYPITKKVYINFNIIGHEDEKIKCLKIHFINSYCILYVLSDPKNIIESHILTAHIKLLAVE